MKDTHVSHAPPPGANDASTRVAANRMIRIPTPSVNPERDRFTFDNEVGEAEPPLSDF
jgi:hypothetical protein